MKRILRILKRIPSIAERTAEQKRSQKAKSAFSEHKSHNSKWDFRSLRYYSRAILTYRMPYQDFHRRVWSLKRKPIHGYWKNWNCVRKNVRLLRPSSDLCCRFNAIILALSYEEWLKFYGMLKVPWICSELWQFVSFKLFRLFEFRL